MKTLPSRILSLSCGLALWLATAAQPADPPPGDAPREANPPAADRADPATPAQPPAAQPADAPEPGGPPSDPPAAAADAPEQPAGDATDRPAPVPENVPAPTPQTSAPEVQAPPPATTTKPLAEGEKGLRLNFRGAPLEMVLNYLSEAAGFIIDLQTEVKGRVDVWSNQPLTKDEAVGVLNAVLSRNGYAVIRNERTLTIVSKEVAKTRDIPVIRENDPTLIPKNEETVTQIIPVRFINATQLIKDLQPLLPSATTVTANEGGNALVITDTQIHIRRMAEIVRALDTAISSTSAIRVFPLKYSDAKALATVIRDLFQTQTTAQQGGNNPMQTFFRGMRGGGGADQGGGGGASGSGNARVVTPRVVATSDDRSNSLVVSAPEDQMLIIEDLVKQVDTNVDDVTEFRVFRLKYADPQETADMLTSLFPDSTSSSSQGGRGQMQFGGGRFGGGAQQASTPSTRLVKQSRVIAVPDLRTGSVVVSASRELMVQITPVIEALDSDPRRKQKVFVFDVENTDPQTVQNIVQSLFPSQNNSSSSYNRNTSQQAGNQLNNRATSASTMQNQGLNSSTQNRTGSGSSLGR